MGCLEHESHSAAVHLENSTCPPLPLSSSCSLLSGGTRGAGLNYGEEGDCDTDAGHGNSLQGRGRTGHASLPVASSWHNKSCSTPSAADALPTVLSTGTNNSVCVCVCVCVCVKHSPAFSFVTLTSLCCVPTGLHENLTLSGPRWWHLKTLPPLKNKKVAVTYIYRYR